MNKDKAAVTEEHIRCPECQSPHIHRDQYRAELVCNNCGFVLDDSLIDYSPEWRAFDHEQQEKKARTGPPLSPLLPDRGLSTVISWKNVDTNGKSIPHKNRAQMYRLRKWQKRIKSGKDIERNLNQALSYIDRNSSSLGLPRTVREHAAIIYRKAIQKDLIRGRRIDCIAAASLYAACRKCQVPRTLYEISDVTNISVKNIGRSYRFLSRELQFKLEPPTSQEYISRFCSELKLSLYTQNKANELLKTAIGENLITGRSPIGIAAAALYVASILTRERKTQTQIAKVSGITEVTIRNCTKDLVDKLEIEI
jgi:transcription initiation factor TFIIB